MKPSKQIIHLLYISLFISLMLSGCFGRLGPPELYQEADDPARFFPVLDLPPFKKDSPVFVYKLYPGKERKNDEVARVQLKFLSSIRLDGLVVDSSEYQEVHLLPGKHHFKLGLDASQMDDESVCEFTAETKANHTYILSTKRINYMSGDGICGFYYFWLEDINSSEVIAGKKKL